eukprot:187138-Chlamydomonas_euryale.AAC.2
MMTVLMAAPLRRTPGTLPRGLAAVDVRLVPPHGRERVRRGVPRKVWSIRTCEGEGRDDGVGGGRSEVERRGTGQP